MCKISKTGIRTVKMIIILSKSNTPQKNDVKIFLWGLNPIADKTPSTYAYSGKIFYEEHKSYVTNKSRKTARKGTQRKPDEELFG